MAAQDDGDADHERTLPASVPTLRCTGIPATAERLAPLRRQLGAWAAAAGASDDLANALILAVDEAMSNVVCHAYDETRPGTFDLYASHDPVRNTIHVAVSDHGRWHGSRPDPRSLRGRGLGLIRALAHEATIERTANGTVVRMTWLLA